MLSISQTTAAQTQMDLTSIVKVDAASWGGLAEYNHTVTTADGRSVKMVEHYYDQLELNDDQPLKQTVTGLEDGDYTVVLYAKTNCANWNFAQPTDFVDGSYDYAGVYAIGEAKDTAHIEADIDRGYKRELKEYTLNAKVVGGTLELGLELYRKDMTNWHTIQIKSLTWNATAEQIDAYKKKLIAANAALVEGASLQEPKEAPFLQNGTFDTGVAPWQTTTGAQNKGTAENQQGAFTGKFYENWDPAPYTGKLYQTINYIPNGLYKLQICAFVDKFADPNNSQYVYANADKTYLTAGEPTAYEVVTFVKDNKIEVGLELTEAVTQWCGIDNVKLLYYGNPVFPVSVNPASGTDIAEELQKAKDALAVEDLPVFVSDVTINLEKGGSYTLNNSIEAAGSIILNGNGATIDASALAASFAVITDSYEENPANFKSGTAYKYVDNVSIDGITVKGLTQSLVQSKIQVMLAELNINNSNIEISGNNVIFNFNGKGYPEALSISNSTMWSAAGQTNFFSQEQNRPKDVYANEADCKQLKSITNSTMYNISVDKKMNNLNQKGQKWQYFTLKNNILVNFGSSTNNEVNGWLGGQNSNNPTVIYENNTYLRADTLVTGWINATKQGADTTATYLTTDPGFKDAANGDFTVAKGTQQDSLATGDPRWIQPLTLAELKDIKLPMFGEKDVTVSVNAAKVTYYNAEMGMGFIEEPDAAAWIGVMSPTEVLATGKALTGTITGTLMDQGAGYNILLIDTFEGTTAEVDVTHGVAIADTTTLVLPENVNRLVTVTNSAKSPIVNDKGNVTVGDIMVFDAFYVLSGEMPEKIKSVTGVMFYGYGIPILVPRSDADIVAAADPIVAPEDAKYYWVANADAVVTEVGGTIVASAAAPERINYPQGAYYTICLNGKKDLSDNKYMTVTLDKALVAGDIIKITAFKSKGDASKKSAALLTFNNGATYNTGDVFNDIQITDPETGEALTPNTVSYTVTDAEAGATSFTMTRGETGTNLFINEFYIVDFEKATAIDAAIVNNNVATTAVYNLAGQKVAGNFKGIVIKNGKKVSVK